MKLKQLDRLVVRVAGIATMINLVLSPVVPGVELANSRSWVESDLVISEEPLEVLPQTIAESTKVIASGYQAEISHPDSLKPAVLVAPVDKPMVKPRRVLGASLVPMAPSSVALMVNPPDYNGVNVPAVIAQAASEYGVSVDIMISIAQCESGLRPGAVNGPFAGIFQFISGTWVSNRNAMGLDPDLNLRFNPEEAAKTAAFKMSRDGYGAWPACSRKALAAR